MPIPQITIEGRVVADPDLRFSASGVAVARIRLVASSRKKEGDDWVDDKTFWINATCFNKTAENVVETVSKGDEVVVSGRIHTEEWETQDGDKRTAPVVLVDSIGPSLRWNAARMLKSERSTGQQQRQESQPQAQGQTQPDEPPF